MKSRGFPAGVDTVRTPGAPDRVIHSLQALRFVAALMVVHAHAVQTAAEGVESSGVLGSGLDVVGRAGVDVFFVISGYIIARTAPGHTSSAFMKKRLIRIMPVYLFWCVPSFFIAAKDGVGWRELAATALWPATDRMSMSVLPVAWTLSFEMLFYAGMALVLLDRRWRWGLLILYAAAFALRPFGPVFQFLGNPIILEFLAGVALAHLPAPRWTRWGAPVGFVALALGGIFLQQPAGDTITFLEGRQALIRLLVLGLPSTLMVLGTLQVRLGRGVLSYLGDASYTLYLTHALVMSVLAAVLQRTSFHAPADLIIVVCIATSVLFAWRTYELIERPLLRFLRRATVVRAPSSAHFA